MRSVSLRLSASLRKLLERLVTWFSVQLLYTMAILFFMLPLLFTSAQAQYIWAIPCRTVDQCTSVLSSSQNYKCAQGFCLCPNMTTKAYELCSNKDMILQAKASALRRNCTEDDDCSVEGASCLPKDPKDKSNKICLCELDRVESEDGQNCLAVAKEIGDPCTEQAQCIKRLEGGAECVDGHCRCRPDHHFGKSKCVRNLAFGEHCELEEDGCYETNSTKGENLLVCTPNYGCRCKRHWTYNQRSRNCEFSSASQMIVQFVTILMPVLMLLIALF